MGSGFLQGNRRRRRADASGLSSRRRHGERLLWGIPLTLVAVAGLLIASTQRQAPYADWYQHWITAAFGIGVALLLARMKLERLKPLLAPIYALTVISLIAVRVIGTSALGAQRWISIGGVHVQPSEFAKLAAILLLAAVLDRHPVERPVDLLRPLGVISLPWLLVFIQPDLGTSLVFGALLLVMLYWSGMPFEWLVLLLAPLGTALLAGLLLGVCGWARTDNLAAAGPAVAVALMWTGDRRTIAVGIRSVAVAAAGALLVMLPWFAGSGSLSRWGRILRRKRYRDSRRRDITSTPFPAPTRYGVRWPTSPVEGLS